MKRYVIGLDGRWSGVRVEMEFLEYRTRKGAHRARDAFEKMGSDMTDYIVIDRGPWWIRYRVKL